MENNTETQRDAQIAAANIQAYNNINIALNISEQPSRAKRGKFSLLVVQFIFTQVESKGVDRLPYKPGSANKDEAVEIASDFIDAYGGIMWPDRSHDDDAEAELGIAMRNFVIIMFSLSVKASQVKDDPDTLVDQFHATQPKEDPEPNSMSEDATMTGLDNVVEEVFCGNCGESFPDRLSLRAHWLDCLSQYKPQYSSTPTGSDSTPRIFQTSISDSIAVK